MAFYEMTYLVANRRWVRPRIEFNLLLNGITRSPSSGHNREVNYFWEGRESKEDGGNEFALEAILSASFNRAYCLDGRQP